MWCESQEPEDAAPGPLGHRTRGPSYGKINQVHAISLASKTYNVMDFFQLQSFVFSTGWLLIS